MSDTVSSLVWSTTPQLAAALKAVDPAVLSRMVNAAFRMPDLSMKYLHERILEANARGTPISPEMLSEELLFRERSHGIDITSAFSSMAPPVQSGVDGGVVAPLHADSLPPLVRAIQPGSIASFPLRYNHADTYTGPRSVLVGDAAHTIHPLAGQGLNMGLADVEALTRTLSAAVRTGGDIGAHTALIPYGRERYAKNHALMSAVDKLHRLYGTSVGNSAPVVWARSVGLEVVNELDTVKKAFMMSAGAKSRVQTSSGSPVWSAVAGGIQAANDLATGAKMVGGVLRSMVGAGLQEVGRRVGGGR
jgi:ubiquinone biosynthesis monooxygenase Coq6